MFEIDGDVINDTTRSYIVQNLERIVLKDPGVVVLYQCIDWVRENEDTLFPSGKCKSDVSEQLNSSIENISKENEKNSGMAAPFVDTERGNERSIEDNILDITIVHGEQLVDRKSIFQVLTAHTRFFSFFFSFLNK